MPVLRDLLDSPVVIHAHEPTDYPFPLMAKKELGVAPTVFEILVNMGTSKKSNIESKS